MKFKLDENLGSRCCALLRGAGHDVETVYSEGLSGAEDRKIYEVCGAEQRCLLTLDLDFSDVIRFPPHAQGGIVVFRLPPGASTRVLEQFAGSLLKLMETRPLMGRLWIVEAGRIRVHQDRGGGETGEG